MKKLTAICISLILVMASAVLAFGDGLYEVDAQSGQIVNAVTEAEAVDYVRISPSCAYDKAEGLYVFTGMGTAGVTFSSSVYSSMYTTDHVRLIADPTEQLTVYLNGESLDFAGEAEYSEPGSYIVRDKANTLVHGFTILSRVTNAVYSYEIPAIFYVESIERNGDMLQYYENSIDLTEDGRYYISYACYDTGKEYTLDVTVDHTPPVLELDGVGEDGYATRAVTVGNKEAGSTLTVLREGEELVLYDTLDTPGDYEIRYTDEAGNTTVYNFTIKVFLNTNAWFAVLIIAALIIGIGVFMIYTRTHTRVR